MNEKTMNLKEIYKIAKKRRLLILQVFLVAVIIAAVASALIPPTYEAETTLRVKQPKGLTDSQLTDQPTNSQFNTKQQMTTYAEILKSRTVVQAVIDATQGDKKDPLAYEDMVNRISVQREKETDILKVKFQAQTPEEAHYVANKLVETFLSRMTMMVRFEHAVAREFIGERLEETRKELDRAETALEQYKRNQKIVTPTEETKSMVERMAALQNMAADNAVNRVSAQAKLASAQQQIADQKPSFIADSVLIQQYKSKLAELEVELVGLKQNYTDKHPRVLATQAAIRETRTKLDTEITRVINYESPSMNPLHQNLVQAKIQAEAEIAAAAAQQEAISRIMAQGEQQLAKLPAKEQGLARLMRDVAVNQEVFSMLAKRYEEAQISEFMQPTDVQVIDIAVAPAKPVKPKIALNVFVASLLGLLLGGVVAYLLECMHRTIRTNEDVDRYLGLPVLGNIPDYAQHANLVNPGGLWNQCKVRLGL